MSENAYIHAKIARLTVAIPSVQNMMLPVLHGISDRRTYSISDLVEVVTGQMHLTDDDLNERIDSGMQKVRHRLTWVKFHLKKAGLVSSPAHGTVVITDDGLKVLKDNPERIDRRFLNARGRGEEEEEENGDELDPEERIEADYKKIEGALKDELLERVKKLSPGGFEHMVLDLCAKMNASVSEHTGKPGDGGIDGIILGGEFQLDKIYIQAKRYATSVSNDQVMAFLGALSGKPTKKGIFITTASIPESARKEVEKNENVSVRLVDGDDLVGLMIKHNAGVVVDRNLTIKKINMGYFEGFDG